MFGSVPIKSGLTFSKVLGGISKTLSIANQVIPLYQQAKPMINNAKTIMSVLKDFNKNPKNSASAQIQELKNTNNTAKLQSAYISKQTNYPTFFQ